MRWLMHAASALMAPIRKLVKSFAYSWRLVGILAWRLRLIDFRQMRLSHEL